VGGGVAQKKTQPAMGKKRRKYGKTGKNKGKIKGRLRTKKGLAETFVEKKLLNPEIKRQEGKQKH